MHALAALLWLLPGRLAAAGPAPAWPDAAVQARGLTDAARAALAPREAVVELSQIEDLGRAVGPEFWLGGRRVRLGFALDLAERRGYLLLTPEGGEPPAALPVDGPFWGGGEVVVLGSRLAVRVHRRLPLRRITLTVGLDTAGELVRLAVPEGERLFAVAGRRLRLGSDVYLALHGRDYRGGAPYTLLFREKRSGGWEKAGELSSRGQTLDPALSWSFSADGRSMTLALRRP